jgi:hypothetical protein
MEAAEGGERDIPVIAALVPLSVRALQAPQYSQAPMDAAIGSVFDVDRLLASFGCKVSETSTVEMAGGLNLPVVRMEKAPSGPVEPP